MKKLLISTSIAALMASNSMVSFAGNVTIPYTFTTGTPAVAGEVNDNFTAVAKGVNDNVVDIAANTDAIAGLGGTTTCPTDMVAVVGSSSLCVDLYEASVYSDAALSASAQLADANITRCETDGSNCGIDAPDPATNAIYAGSVKDVFPNRSVSWYQAAQACANVGKRLPTTAEWQLAASGTPSGTGNGTDGCNASSGNPLVITGKAATCVSNVGAFDMVGNLAEWSADLHAIGSGGATSTDSAEAWALGDTKSASGGTGTPSTKSLFVPGSASSQNAEIGFRCVK